MQAEVDGERLDRRRSRRSSSCSGAGNETTATAINHGMVALSRYPDEGQMVAERTSTASRRPAVEEIVRWATPVIFMRRILTVRTWNSVECEMRAGEKVLDVVQLANRDGVQVRRSVAVRCGTNLADPFGCSRSAGPAACADQPGFSARSGIVAGRGTAAGSGARRHGRSASRRSTRSRPSSIGIKRLQVGWTPPGTDLSVSASPH